MKIWSAVFKDKGLIPMKYTCNGQDISPPLEWDGVPEKAESLVMICDDPDAPVGNWDHWILFNLPPAMKGLKEAITDLPKDVGVGMNSWGREDYGGPCPPDREHRYFFKLYALDIKLKLKNGATKNDVEKAMKDHILAEATLIGKYDQPRH